MTDVTKILSQFESGDPSAAEQLLPLVYDELRRLATAKLAGERPGQTLQATALVHEAYLRLVDVQNAQSWDSRGRFFAAAAEAMRRILIDKARRKSSQKRGANTRRQQFEDSRFDVQAPTAEILAVHDALDALAGEDDMAAEVVKLRYFVGMSNREIADALDVSPRTVDRHWAFARAWLQRTIED